MLWLALQMVLALVTVFVVDRVALGPRRGLEIASRDIWLPLVMVAPLLVLAVTGGREGGAGWVPVGAVITVATISLGIALIAKTSERFELRPAMIMWVVAGVVVLLLGAAHALFLSVGQCALGAGVVLMWVNTPPHEPADGSRGGGLFLATLLAIGHGSVAIQGDPRITGGIAVGTAVAIAIVFARRRGAADTLALSGWAAAYGVLLGLGLISTSHLLPQIRPILAQQQSTLAALVSFGFGRRAIDGALLLAAVPVAVAAWRAPTGLRRAVGILLVLAGIAAAAHAMLDRC